MQATRTPRAQCNLSTLHEMNLQLAQRQRQAQAKRKPSASQAGPEGPIGAHWAPLGLIFGTNSSAQGLKIRETFFLHQEQVPRVVFNVFQQVCFSHKRRRCHPYQVQFFFMQ